MKLLSEVILSQREKDILTSLWDVGEFIIEEEGIKLKLLKLGFIRYRHDFSNGPLFLF